MYDLFTSEETRITTSGAVKFPSIYDDRIVWLDDQNGNFDIYIAILSSNSINERILNISNSSENVSSKIHFVPGFELSGSLTSLFLSLSIYLK